MIFYHNSVIELVLDEKKYLLKFGQNLRQLRRKSQLTQEHLAIDSDIPINQVGRIERGEINTTVTTLLKISKALKVEIIELFMFK
ncbi:hypothetical protein ULMA_04190 [Patiriisocius marinus]|uniref:HTH cro/C1-type domain-containing protein n=1 Tax=Patiriisocius marinus TaxID=1397112 RepID=A0A5J4IXL2_9FLAO|nr:hypothetical protein ULMA_04190 [Patiriisocius marinus]